jgi:hypothetical protein
MKNKTSSSLMVSLHLHVLAGRMLKKGAVGGRRALKGPLFSFRALSMTGPLHALSITSLRGESLSLF